MRDIEQAIERVQYETPTDLCPYCKGTAGVRCGVCFENGWVTRTSYESAPAEKRGEPSKKKPSARVVIANEDGSETEVSS